MVAGTEWLWSNCVSDVTWGCFAMFVDGTSFTYSDCQIPLGHPNCGSLESNGAGIFTLTFFSCIISFAFAILITMQNYGKTRLISLPIAMVYLLVIIVLQSLAVVVAATGLGSVPPFHTLVPIV